MKESAEIGVVGMGVMGKSLALNLAGKGVSVSVYNRHVPEKEEFIATSFAGEHSDLPIQGHDELVYFIDSLKKPAKILFMITAGAAVDYALADFKPYLTKGAVIMDGGNSYYKDTSRREKQLKEEGLHYLGVGISGGEEGALKGPALMPGGDEKGYQMVHELLNILAAKDKNGKACSSYLGSGGAGHFVKMVHNGIEYAEMQILAEAYHYLKQIFNLENEKIADFFKETSSTWGGGFLSEITEDILRHKETDGYLLDKILDKSKQKGTGSWTIKAAFDYGIPAATIAEAVSARFISSGKERRVQLSGEYLQKQPYLKIQTAHKESIQKTIKMARVINHNVGFELIAAAAKEYSWELNLAEVARIWTNGCIIRSKLMEDFISWLEDESILQNKEVVQVLKAGRDESKEVLFNAIKHNLPMPVINAALNHLNSITAAHLPANLIQAQRDYFGAHTYQRADMPENEYFHTQWKP